MKKITLFATLALCILLLAGCAAKPQKPSGETNPHSSSAKSEENELASLRSSIAEKDCILGIGFLGYILR